MPPAVHDLSQVEGGAALTEHVADGGSEQEAPELVQTRPHHLGSLPVRKGFVLLPEGLQADGIVELLGETGSDLAIEE